MSTVCGIWGWNIGSNFSGWIVVKWREGCRRFPPHPQHLIEPNALLSSLSPSPIGLPYHIHRPAWPLSTQNSFFRSLWKHQDCLGYLYSLNLFFLHKQRTCKIQDEALPSHLLEEWDGVQYCQTKEIHRTSKIYSLHACKQEKKWKSILSRTLYFLRYFQHKL